MRTGRSKLAVQLHFSSPSLPFHSRPRSVEKRSPSEAPWGENPVSELEAWVPTKANAPVAVSVSRPAANCMTATTGKSQIAFRNNDCFECQVTVRVRCEGVGLNGQPDKVQCTTGLTLAQTKTDVATPTEPPAKTETKREHSPEPAGEQNGCFPKKTANPSRADCTDFKPLVAAFVEIALSKSLVTNNVTRVARLSA